MTPAIQCHHESRKAGELWLGVQLDWLLLLFIVAACEFGGGLLIVSRVGTC
jgi:hypothetical protein